MNMRRRSLADSMQLLVDTICNLFGSIIIISLLIGGSLLGVIGAILAVPTAAILQVLFEETLAEPTE